MRSPNYYILLVILMLILSACENDHDYYTPTPLQENLENRLIDLYGSLESLELPASNDFTAIPSDVKNPLTSAKVKLGKFLYHETALALNPTKEEGMGTYSCASCHHAAAGFQSGIIQGIGEGGIGFGIHGEDRVKSSTYEANEIDVQPIRSPSILNAAYQEVMLWNGQFGAKGMNAGTEASWTPGTPKETNTLGFEGVETQAIAGLGVHRMMVDKNILYNANYIDLFDEAFPNDLEEIRYSKTNAGLAIAAYERTVLPNEAPFQKWLKGDVKAMSNEELAGALLFFDKAKCYICHSGPGLNGMSFHALGMNDLAGENVFNDIDEATRKGRGGFTGKEEDNFKFKTPQLYNLKDVEFLGHGGSFSSVKEVVTYKNKGVAENAEVPLNKLSSLFVPLGLSEHEVDLIALFIENSLYDSKLMRYQPESLPSGNCLINADAQSSEDMGCN
ncbi:cytochrome-c peroxidase [Tamlana fucoidanivorans]|uniref:Cytochrome-c peroxidase n=1 Tax=Allotamlana fucoidanivorans TaxID=2583814 RepID=A0A5C4SM12_9FLAO|nr:cytochrome c peroxidase [Tamlana fucoidanivorans]TNJ44332.1 cytochrome-c peroxidase [Tamlana fucoidanivorans]